MGICKLLGKRTSISQKTGQSSSTLHLAAPFSEYESENSVVCEGESVFTEWTTLDVSDLKVGSMIQLFYEKTSTGKARLAGFKVVKQQS